MMLRKSIIICTMLVVPLQGCASQPPLVAIRSDGQLISGNGALTHQYEIDKTVCHGETQKAHMSGVTVHGGGLAGAFAQAERNAAGREVMKGCLAQKGYLLVPADQAEARAAQFRDVAQGASTSTAPISRTTGSLPRKTD